VTSLVVPRSGAARIVISLVYLISLGGGTQDLGLGSAGTIILTLVIAAVGLARLKITSRGSAADRS
jgi:multiple sugar transport system permease protein